MWFQWMLHKWDKYVVIYSQSVYKSLTNKVHVPASAGKHKTNSSSPRVGYTLSSFLSAPCHLTKLRVINWLCLCPSRVSRSEDEIETLQASQKWAKRDPARLVGAWKRDANQATLTDVIAAMFSGSNPDWEIGLLGFHIWPYLGLGALSRPSPAVIPNRCWTRRWIPWQAAMSTMHGIPFHCQFC